MLEGDNVGLPVVLEGDIVGLSLQLLELELELEGFVCSLIVPIYSLDSLDNPTVKAKLNLINMMNRQPKSKRSFMLCPQIKNYNPRLLKLMFCGCGQCQIQWKWLTWKLQNSDQEYGTHCWCIPSYEYGTPIPFSAAEIFNIWR